MPETLQEGACLLDMNLDNVIQDAETGPYRCGMLTTQQKLKATPALGPHAVSHTFFSCGSWNGEDKLSLETTSDFCFQIGNSITGSNFL